MALRVLRGSELAAEGTGAVDTHHTRNQKSVGAVMPSSVGFDINCYTQM